MVQDLSAEVLRLDEEIASLSAHMAAADYELLVKIRRFDELSGWANQGALSCAQWLSYRIGLDPGAAREKLRVAHALASLPEISEAFRAGRISYSKVRAMTRIANDKNEAELVNLGLATTAAQLERVVRACRRVTSEQAAKAPEKRFLWIEHDEDGMVVIRGRLLADEGALLAKALDCMPTPKEPMDFAKRRADALVEVAKAALAAGEAASSDADRFQVVVHVDADVLAGASTDGRSEIEGHGVSAESAQRVACDASVVEMVDGPDGEPVSVGRKTRRISTPLRRALRERDQTCRFPGCTHRIVDVHHVRPWAKGGPSTLDNTLSLCRAHHVLVHEGGFSLERDSSGALVFRDPNGRVVDRTPPAVSGQVSQVLSAEPRMLACWAGDKMDLGYVVSAFCSIV